MATTTNQDDYEKISRKMDAFGYGIAGTYFILPGLQVKLSYEKAYRLPTIEEMFGDETWKWEKSPSVRRIAITST